MQAMADDTQPESAPQANAFDFQDWAEETEGKYQVDCQPTMLTDAEFAPPSDVIFQDMTELFQQMGELGKQIDNNSNDLPGSSDMEQMEEMFKGLGIQTEEMSQE
jgi:hypothetical protein